MANPKTKKTYLGEESIEAKPQNRYIEPTTVNDEIKDLWKGMLKSTQHDLLGGLGSTFSEQLLGGASEQQMTEGQAISLKKQREEAREKPQISAEHMSYFRKIENADSPAETQVERAISQQVEQIRLEIRKLVKTSKLVERTVKDATADQAPIRPGKYHLNFFEFVLSVLRDATRKLEDSASYGALFQSKKQQSKYWNKVKTSGTSFMLSGERTTATQTG